MNTNDTYLGATESELRAASGSKRLLGYASQRRLFPHQGRIALGPDALILEGWREIPRTVIDRVVLDFTDSYPRRLAGGFRGQYTSLGLFGSLGKPLILSLRGDEPVYLLIGFRWLTGTNRARHWAAPMQSWLTEERIQ